MSDKIGIPINGQSFDIYVPEGYHWACLSESGRMYLFEDKPYYNESMQQWEGNGFATSHMYSRPPKAQDTLKEIPEDHVKQRNINRQAEDLVMMDRAIRSLNDEENGIFDSWISLYVPDEASKEEIMDICEMNPDFYDECCEFFSRNIADLIVNGEYTKEGWCAEFFSSRKDNGEIQNY